MSEICSQCNHEISQQNANMLFFEKEQLCNLFYAQKPNNVKINPITPKNNMCLGNHKIPNSEQLVGYYIIPTLVFGPNNYKIDFYPIWLVEDTHQVYEYVAVTAIGIDVIASDMHSMPQPSPQSTLGVVDSIIQTIIPGSSFDHSVLQFYDLAANNFDRAYISRHELIMIANYSEYIGITGARISTGNIVGDEPSTNPRTNLLYISENRNYFTYRFIGFNEVKLPDSPPDPPKPYDKASSHVKARILSSQIYLRKANTEKNGYIDHSIPAETWATPCPPRWNPQ